MPRASARPSRPARPARAEGRRAPRPRRASAGVALAPPPAPPAPAGLLVGWGNPARNQPETILPSFAPVNVSPANGAWSAWVQVTAGEAADAIIAAVHECQIFTTGSTAYYQLGTGPAGSETVVYEWAYAAIISGSGSLPLTGRTHRTAPIKLPAGTRLAMRGYGSPGFGGPGGHYVALLPFDAAQTWESWTDDYPHGLKAARVARTPAAPAYVALNTTNVWYELIASAATDLLLAGVERPTTDVGQNCIIEIGTGAAGAEVVQSRIGIPGTGGVILGAGYHEPARKPRIIAGERVAARCVTINGVALAAYVETI